MKRISLVAAVALLFAGARLHAQAAKHDTSRTTPKPAAAPVKQAHPTTHTAPKPEAKPEAQHDAKSAEPKPAPKHSKKSTVKKAPPKGDSTKTKTP